jgi:hypothetical protein
MRRLIALSLLLAVVSLTTASFSIVGVTGLEVAAAQDAPTTPSAPEASRGQGTSTASPDSGAAEALDAGTYAVRLRDLEQRINELKAQIFRSKARLSLLAETVLNNTVAGAQAAIVHENRMSSSFKLVKAVYALDGAPIFNRADEDGELGEREQFDVYNGQIVPGEHTLTVNLEYRGHGYGIFSYLQGYRFRVRSSHNFTAPEGRGISIRVVAYEKGGPTAPLEERPAVRYIERILNRAEMNSASATGGEGSASGSSGSGGAAAGGARTGGGGQ